MIADAVSDDGLQGVTLWRRIADEIEQAIVAGAYATGDRLPGEIEIAGRFRVNRHTVRRAIADLAQRGLVRAERGSGTFVAPGRLTYPVGLRTRFSEIVGTAGREVGGRLVADAEEAASRTLAERLGVAPGEPVVRLEILRSADRVPICITTAWLVARHMADAAKVFRAKRGLTATFAHYGISDYRRATTHISAAMADAVDAQRLRIPPGRPLLVIESTDVTLSGEPLSTKRSRFVADRVELVVEN
ncbi:MAG: phosphonate metabolism transcriptional regulator PhnF [Xanthobacteraceae bacterium]|nr:phosphonate metabolism transcriptional regulator PhnF [Xanthobacteraceae bacterium]